jgi:hypothetical protein
VRNLGYFERVKPLYSEVTLPHSQPHSAFAFKLCPVETEESCPTDRSTDLPAKSRTKPSAYATQLEIESRTDSGIEDRKRRLQERVETSNTIKTLVKMLGQQAGLDEGFRNQKIWFEGEGEGKWEELRAELRRGGLGLTEEELREEFSLQESENNPFFSVTDNKCDCKSLVSSYLLARTHWNEKISRQFSAEQLSREGFSCARVDFDGKGYIQVEDLVRFLNVESGSFLRNRDVSLIFRRIARADTIDFPQLLAAVSH